MSFMKLNLRQARYFPRLIYTKNDWNERRYPITPLYANIKKEGDKNKMTGTIKDLIEYRINRAKRTPWMMLIF